MKAPLGTTRGRLCRVAAAVAFGCALLAGAVDPLWGQAAAASERRVVDRAERLRAAGNPSEASAALRGHLARAPASLDALALLGEMSLEVGEAAEFLVYAEAAVAAAPDEAGARRWWIRALVAASRPDSALAVARRWVEERPATPAARLAEADVRLVLGDTVGAIRSLEGAAAPASGDVLARLADLFMATGAVDDLVASWDALLALDPPRTDDVVDDLRRAGGEQRVLLERLGRVLGGRAGPAVRAGAIVALRLSQAGVARRLADEARGAGEVEDAAFLRGYVREADAVDLAAEVAWAARHLVGLSRRPVDRWRWQALSADRSLTAGDTGSARRAFNELARASQPGDGPHQLASRRLFSLLAIDPDALDDAADLLDRYVAQYPDSSRAEARMRAELAIGHARASDLPAAEAVLADARSRVPSSDRGPLDAAAARLSLYAGRSDSARVQAGRSVLQGGLEEGERTRRLTLLTLLQTADSSDIRVLGAAVHQLSIPGSAFDPGPTLRELAGLPGSGGRPTVLAFLASVAAEAGHAEVAAALLQQVADQHPGSPEAPKALLELARSAAPEGAATWLERLIIGYPESALAPVARRMLIEIEGRGDGT